MLLPHQVETENAELATLNDRLRRLVEQQRQQAELLHVGAEGARSMLDNLPAAVLGIDPDGMVAYANRVASAPSMVPLGWSAGTPLRVAPRARRVELDGLGHHALAAAANHADDGGRGRLLVLLPEAEAAMEAQP